MEMLCGFHNRSGSRVPFGVCPSQPDWFAVRGAVCPQRDRRQAARAEAVRRLADLLAEDGRVN